MRQQRISRPPQSHNHNHTETIRTNRPRHHRSSPRSHNPHHHYYPSNRFFDLSGIDSRKTEKLANCSKVDQRHFQGLCTQWSSMQKGRMSVIFRIFQMEDDRNFLLGPYVKVRRYYSCSKKYYSYTLDPTYLLFGCLNGTKRKRMYSSIQSMRQKEISSLTGRVL